MTSATAWQDPDATLTKWVEKQQRDVLAVYAADPLLVDEHGRQEDSYRTGGYANRQVLELAQNAADALSRSGRRGRVEFRLTPEALYCANEGAPFDLTGLRAVSHAHLSGKSGPEMGRFGLGFKSVLGITGSPSIFSRSVSVGFDEAIARDKLRAVAPDAESFPILRWPMVLDAESEMSSDQTLRELGAWASTVVRLPLDSGRDRLVADLREFPAQFLLFAEHVEQLVVSIADASEPFATSMTCEALGENRRRIKGGGTRTDWLVWHRLHRPSPEALAEVGQAIRRSEVRVSYAAPLDDVSQMGRFWAHFPLQDQTSARGIHNAPWRVNDDRTSMLPGVFNHELLDVLGGLIVEAMPALATPEDPARHFDYLPARGREAAYDADKYLTDLIPVLARKVACVPDGTGRLRPPEELSFLNTDIRQIEGGTFELWQRRSPEAEASPHSSCYSNLVRRARLRSLVRPDEKRLAVNEVGLSTWLENLVPDGSDEQCRNALGVLFSITDLTVRRECRTARVIPEEGGALRDLNSIKDLFISGDILSGAAGLALMRHSFVDDELTVVRLRELGFTDVDPAVELRQVLRGATRKWAAGEWDAFWNLVLEVPVTVADECLERHAAQGGEIRVRARSGKWMPPYSVVFPGLIQPVNLDLAVDDSYHEDHQAQLVRLGVGIRPVASQATLHDLTYLEYLRHQRERYMRQLSGLPRPEPSGIHVLGDPPLGPLYVLMKLADAGDKDAQTAWTRELLEAEVSEHVDIGHVANSKRFPHMKVQAPHLWAAARYGLLDTSWGPRPAAGTLSPDLREHVPLLPVALHDAAAKVTTVERLADVPIEVWTEFLARVPSGGSPWALGRLVVEASERIPSSQQTAVLPAVLGKGYVSVSPGELLLAATEEECGVLVAEGRPFLAISDAASLDLLCERYGCRPASSTLRVEYVLENPSEPVGVLDSYGGLRSRAAGRLDGWEITTCSDLYQAITTPEGTRTLRVDVAFTDRTILHTAALDEEDVLSAISKEFALGLDVVGIGHVLEDAQDQRVKKKIADCRASRDLPGMLLALLPAAALESKLPTGLLEAVRASTGDLGAIQVAELLHHVHGYNVLIDLKHLLEKEGFKTPHAWAGSQGAVAFVGSLGFPVEYAGSRGGTLDASLTVLGPPGLNPLHPYQEELRDQIRDLVRSVDQPGRALLYLPTGAGKTRVTVQALIESIVAGEVTGPLIWIAQTEELCEQAVQTWSTAWREFGTSPLKLYRLWSNNNIAESDDTVCVVIATDAKLSSIRQRDDYQWLAERAHAVVIDEAHGATATGITATLRWLGIGGRQTSRPLLGLTATPFKGRNDESNERLRRRFGGRLLNVLGSDPYTALQDLGVLARVEHRELGGGDFRLDDEELPHFAKFRDVPPAVLDRIGKDETRMRALIQDVTSLPDDWPVLVFTASVLSAQVLAALLRVQGVEAATVSGSTPMYERRRTIESFRENRIRVLTNCNVLTEGFDAPAIRALYIARPTFSPNAYIQMVGRGLRGPKNGGKEECLVVNVADTFSQFGESLAYREFSHLWDQAGTD